MSALIRMLDGKTAPFFDGDNPLTPLEYAVWFTWQGTTAVDMEQAAQELAALRSENEQMRAQNVELLAGLEKIAAGNPAKVGGWLSDVEMADIARATLAKARGISLKEG